MNCLFGSWAPCEDSVIFCFKRAVHGLSAGNLLRYCLRALLCDFVMALSMIVQRPFAGNMLRLACSQLLSPCFVHTIVILKNVCIS